MSINIDGVEYVEKNYERIFFSDWSPKAFVIGFSCGFFMTTVLTIAVYNL